MVSYKITTTSIMFQPLIKVVCEGRMIFWATRAILFVMALVKILKLTFKRQIGLNCWIYFASFSFGKRVIIPKLRLNNGSSPL
jgi:hypothetical protein